VSGELEPYGQSPAEMETEFGSYPEEVRQAALEYARGLALGRAQADSLPEAGDVQFILVGVRQAGRAIVFASSAVTEAKFARQMDGFDRVPIRPGPNAPVARVPRITAIVGAKMTSFEQIAGADYREALASLISEWDRKKEAARREAGIRELQEKCP
jgi:hypothetical protein